jgi:hypothetical protein
MKKFKQECCYNCQFAEAATDKRKVFLGWRCNSASSRFSGVIFPTDEAKQHRCFMYISSPWLASE